MIARATLAAALVLVASVVAAQTIYFPPPGGGPVTATIPWPIPVGGTGSTGDDFDTGGCVYFDGTRLRTIAASCQSSAAITVSVGGVAVLTGVSNVNFSSSQFTVTANGSTRVDVALKPTVSPTPTFSPTPTAMRTPGDWNADVDSVGNCTVGACLSPGNGTAFWLSDLSSGFNVNVNVQTATLTSNRNQILPNNSGVYVVACQAPLVCGADGIVKMPSPTPSASPSPQPTVGAIGDCTPPRSQCFGLTANTDCLYFGADGGGNAIAVCPPVADDAHNINWPNEDGTIVVKATSPLAISDGVISFTGGRVLTRTADTTVNTIAAETDLTSVGGLAVPILGTTYRLHTAGTIQDQTGGGTATYRVRFGGSPVCDTGAFDPTGTGAIGYTLDVTLTVRQAGSSAVVQCGGVFTYDDATANLSDGHRVFTSNLTGIDLDGTPSIVLKTTVQFSAASVNDTAMERVAVFELVP